MTHSRLGVTNLMSLLRHTAKELDKMFKIARVRVVRLASLCAILFVASSFLASIRTIQTVNCSAHNQNDTDEGNQQKSTTATTSSNVSTLVAASVTNDDRAVAGDEAGRKTGSSSSLSALFRSIKTGYTHNGSRTDPQRQPAIAGKIIDYMTTDSRRHYHTLSPRRLNSTNLLRLVALPFKNKSSYNHRQADQRERASRARSIAELNTNERNNQNSNGTIADELAAAAATGREEAKRATPRRSRHFGDVLRGARNLLSSGISSIEQRAGSIFQLGSSLLATLIPLVSLIGSSSHSSSSAESSGESNLTASIPSRVASLLAPPQKLIQIAANSGGIQSRVEHVMDWLERSIEHLPNFPRLHPQECVKRSICEAHNEPTKYGTIGLALRMLFPATNFSGPTSEQDNMEFKVINKYRHAAGYGQLRRLDSTTNANSTTGNAPNWPSSSSSACKEKYEDCLVSLLDVTQKLFDLFAS